MYKAFNLFYLTYQNLFHYSLVKLKGDVLDLESDLPNELLYGRVGYLYALLLVKQRVSQILR